MKLKILVTAGDGIGPEVTNEAVAVLREVAALGGHTFEFNARRIGGVAIVNDGTPLPAETLDVPCRRTQIQRNLVELFLAVTLTKKLRNEGRSLTPGLFRRKFIMVASRSYVYLFN